MSGLLFLLLLAPPEVDPSWQAWQQRRHLLEAGDTDVRQIEIVSAWAGRARLKNGRCIGRKRSAEMDDGPERWSPLADAECSDLRRTENGFPSVSCDRGTSVSMWHFRCEPTESGFRVIARDGRQFGHREYEVASGEGEAIQIGAIGIHDYAEISVLSVRADGSAVLSYYLLNLSAAPVAQ